MVAAVTDVPFALVELIAEHLPPGVVLLIHLALFSLMVPRLCRIG